VIDLNGQVAIVTGAGGGLGREHALLLARRGAKVVVNDLGGDVSGAGGSASAAMRTVADIVSMGGEALANGASVTDEADVATMVREAIERWGRIDILVNNAGILRDRTFSKMTIEDFKAVIDVHLMGAVHCVKAVWDHMKANRYGRIVLTTSSSGLFGNFGQSNYGAAKMALVGLMQTLGLEGERYGIHVNCVAPTAGTRMMDGLIPDEIMRALASEKVSPGVLALVAPGAPNRAVLCAGAGGFERSNITLTRGIFCGGGELAAETILDQWADIADRADEIVPHDGSAQRLLELQKAGYHAEELGA
jgi:NAD(P)-dependent dehydrogenase (short-subunit alcohol dehydrogenase family)